VFEGEREHEYHEEEEEEEGATKQVVEPKEKHQKVRTMMTETMQEEYDVEDLLMAQSHGAISGAVSEAWNREAVVDEEEDGAEETPRSENRPNRRHQPLFALDSDDDAIDRMMMSFPLDGKSSRTGDKGKGERHAGAKKESEGEDLVKSEARPYHQVQRRASFDDDDDEINRIFSDGREMTPYTLEELMASSPQQLLSLNSHLSGSPLQARDQNRRATIPFSTPANLTKRMGTRRLAGSGPTPLTPSPVGTLPEVTYTLRTQLLQSSPAHAPSSSKRSHVPSASKSHQTRRSSLESVNSEVPFPLSGTKASTVKAILERYLKESPYAPPSGTKAAAVIASQHQPRPRKQRG
jgi:hypothetical protein